MEARSPSGRRGAAVLFVAFALCGGGDGIARAVGEQSLPQRAEDTEPLAPGELVRCTIVDADGYDLIARPSDQLDRVMTLPVVG